MSNELINKKDIWNPHFYKNFLGFSSILPLWHSSSFAFMSHWPAVCDYNALAEKMEKSNAFSYVRFVEQQKEMVYVQEIANSRVLTRSELWHDFFNNMTWLAWPRLKSAIYQKLLKEKSEKQRSSLQNLLTHFDESGMVICCDDPNLFELIRNFEWKNFFYKTKNLLIHCEPILIGHGLLERALNPFLGMTAKALFLQVPTAYFSLPQEKRYAYVDEEVAAYLLSEAFPKFPKALHPFPFLGWPAWYPENQTEIFFDNTDYFRTGRSAAQQSNELAWCEGRSL